MIRVSLPTDNLYKFKAIAGLVLIIVSLVTIASMLLSSRNNNYKVEAAIAAIKAEISYYKDQAKAVNHEADLIMKVKARNDFYKKESYSVLDRYHKLQDMNLGIQKKIEEISSTNRIHAEKLHSDLFLYIYLILISIFGYYLSISGFVSWYHLHQKYQDKIIRLQYIQIKRDSRRYYKKQT